MKLHKLVEQFDRQTGRPLSPTLEETDTGICDYTGEVIADDCESRPQYTLTSNYDTSCEEVYYYDKDKEWFDDRKCNYASVFNSPFTFKPLANGMDTSLNLVLEWMAGIADKTSIFFDCVTIEQAMRIARVRTVKKLLEDKKYTVEELGL